MANPVDQEIRELVAGQTVPTEFLKTVAARGDAPALNWRNDDGGWGTWTFAEYAQKVAQVAAGLDAQGVEAGDRVVLMMRNIPQFHLLDMACYFLGATPVSIYNSSSVDQIAYLAGHCQAKLAVAEDNSFLARFRPARAKLPDLEFLGAASDPWGNTKAAFVASTEIERRDWGLTWNVPLDQGGLLVSEKLKIEIETQAARQV